MTKTFSISGDRRTFDLDLDAFREWIDISDLSDGELLGMVLSNTNIADGLLRFAVRGNEAIDTWADPSFRTLVAGGLVGEIIKPGTLELHKHG